MSQSRDRRDFLRSLGATLTAGSARALLPQLGLVGSALAAVPRGKAFGNYRALVCVYLDGGNDSWNLLVPRDSTGPGSLYSTYRDARGGLYDAGTNPDGLALDFAALRPISPDGFAASSFGLHPQCADYTFTPQGGSSTTQSGLASLFAQQRLGMLVNVGTLVQPITKATYNTTPRPPQLYSHNDQTTLWHLGRTNPNHPYGWGGELASRVDSGNQLQSLAPCISIAGSSRFLVGDGVYPYQMSTSGATSLSNYSATAGGLQSARRAALDQMLTIAYPHPFGDEYARLTTRSLDLATTIGDALTGFGSVATPYQQTSASNTAAAVTVAGTDYSNSLLDQLRMVARMIKVSRPGSGAGINHERQVFLVRLGGFDTHDTQMSNTGQPLLLARLNQALAWFWRALSDMGVHNEVTLFTMSEFARTLSSNGNGSDHAWGGVQLALGGAVAGRKLYGTFPNQTLDGPDSFSRGQFLPTTPVDTYAATLARWMGVPDIDLEQVFPNLVNFSPDTLPFLP
ncbi:MAG: DUF1501 domain-containing protein [Xanthomonadales bacterium]|nr:DUF1501 domain-containing protein [Xanthomonadales bacterium]